MTAQLDGCRRLKSTNTPRRSAAFSFLLSCALVCAHTVGAAVWKPTRLLAGPFAASSPPEAPLIRTSAAGHTLAVWNATGVIRHADHLPGNPWSASAAVLPGATGNAFTAAIGSDDTAAVAWTSVPSRYVPAQLFVSLRPPGGGFGAATGLGSGAGVSWLGLGVAGDGSVVVLCQSGGALFASRASPAGVWSAMVQLGSNSGTAFPSFAINDSGSVVLAWQQADGNGTAISAALGSPDGSWSVPQRVSVVGASTAISPLAGIDAAGGAVVAYQQDARVFASMTLPGAAWSTPMPVSPSGTSVDSAALAVNALGDILIAWRGVDGSGVQSVQSRFRAAGGNWRGLLTQSTADQAPGIPAAALADDGTGAIGWVDDNALEARVAVRRPDGAWIRRPAGPGWWGSTVSVSAGGASVAAAWAAPNPRNVNAASLFARIFE